MRSHHRHSPILHAPRTSNPPPPLLPHLPLLLLLSLTFTLAGASRPSILFIVVDDAGYADFQKNDASMHTANIEALREDGVYLNQSYVLPMCGPSRAAFMTGRYPHTFGLQDNTVNANMINWINETFTFLPRALQRLNYSTHMLGKWHLGFCHPGLTPMGRGFDSFYGFLLGSHDSYYSHTKNNGAVYDWWDNDRVDFSARGTYQTELLNDRALKIVRDHRPGTDKPFFMYLSYGAPHGPFEVPEHYMDTYCPDITNRSRRIHCGMMAVVDVGVGALVSALKEKGIYDDAVILFLSDNGGPIKGGSVNYPLRAGKKNLYEGGIRSYTVLKGPGFKHTNVTWSGLVHAVDWFPTLVGAAGGGSLSYTHGYDLYDTIKENRNSPREDFIIASDFAKFNHTVLRWKQWKMFTSIPGLERPSRWIPGFSSGWYPPYQLLEQGVPWENVGGRYQPGTFLLYNVEQDPEERHDLYDQLKDEPFVQSMKDRITRYLGTPPLWNGIYPLHPLPATPFPKTTRNTRGGVLVSCWCFPAGLPDCRSSASSSSTTPGPFSVTVSPSTPRGSVPAASTTTPGRETSGGRVAGLWGGGGGCGGLVLMVVLVLVVLVVFVGGGRGW
ncbi:arylsulfatase B-like [Babylonia areolata]|uniref:arylsulfatase B-like n=1 Tax=Babylonia areolata TaxID=304850 RepID=UPI003FD53A9A